MWRTAFKVWMAATILWTAGYAGWWMFRVDPIESWVRVLAPDNELTFDLWSRDLWVGADRVKLRTGHWAWIERKLSPSEHERKYMRLSELDAKRDREVALTNIGILVGVPLSLLLLGAIVRRIRS